MKFSDITLIEEKYYLLNENKFLRNNKGITLTQFFYFKKNKAITSYVVLFLFGIFFFKKKNGLSS